jgi:N-acetylneuraminate lyase
MKMHGLVVAAHTPFTADGTLNLAAVEKQAAHFMKHKLEIAFIGGSTGESQSLSLDERLQLATRWFEVVRGSPLKVVVHVGSNSLPEACALARQAEKLGAAAVAAFAPCYFKPRSVEVLSAFCAEIAAAAPATPFYYYDIPCMTGVSLPMHEFLAVAGPRIPNLAGIKYTNSDLGSYQQCLHAEGGRYDVPYGTDEWILAALALGAQGAVGSTYNFAAPLYQRLIAAFQKGDLAGAQREQLRSVQLVRLLNVYGYMGSAKALMAMLDVEVGPARLPNVALTAEQAKDLQARLEQLGFFDWIK